MSEENSPETETAAGNKNKKTAAKPRTTELIFRHEQAPPGTEKRLFNLLCVADEEGFFCCKVSVARAKAEITRRNHYKFEKK